MHECSGPAREKLKAHVKLNFSEINYHWEEMKIPAFKNSVAIKTADVTTSMIESTNMPSMYEIYWKYYVEQCHFGIRLSGRKCWSELHHL